MLGGIYQPSLNVASSSSATVEQIPSTDNDLLEKYDKILNYLKSLPFDNNKVILRVPVL
jgi:hypothetical protein